VETSFASQLPNLFN